MRGNRESESPPAPSRGAFARLRRRRVTQDRSHRRRFVRPAALCALLCGALYPVATALVPDTSLDTAVRAAQPSKSFNLRSSSNSNLDNDDPTGVTGRGDELWVINNDNDRRFRYQRSDGSGGTANSLPDSANSNATGMWAEGTTLWVADWNDTRLYAYNIANSGNLSDRNDSADIDLAGSNDGPRGVTGHDGIVWVVDKDDTYVYAYTTTGNRASDSDFDLKGGNGNPWGIWTDGDTAWVNDRDDNIIRAYDLTTAGKPLLPDSDIDLRPDNANPVGMWSDGETLWVADSSDTYVYAYDLDDARKSSRDIDLASSNDHPVRIAGDGARIWVADSDDTYVYAYLLANGNRSSDREFDMSHSGHGSADGMWAQGNSMWVLDNSDKELYTYNKTSGAPTDNGFDSSLGVSLKGVWGDSTRVLILSPTGSALYAYTYGGESDVNRNVYLARQFFDMAGVWSDGELVWVLDRGNTNNPARLYAHRLSNGNRLAGLDVGLSPHNADPRGVYGSGDTIWVGDGDDTNLYAYQKPAYTDPSFIEGDSTIRSVDENVAGGTAVGARVAADDPDGDPLEYSLAGADAAAFTIGTSSGQIRVKAGTSLDSETRQSYEVRVRVTDRRNANRQVDPTTDDTIDVTITVNDVDEPGTVTLSLSLPQAGVALIASLSDPDGSVSGLSWQWSRRRGTSGGFTNIVGADGASYTPIDGDVDYFLRATASYTDNEGPVKAASATTTQAVVIPNADPMFDAGTASRRVDEHAAAGSAVGTPVVANDPDGDALTYSLVGDDAAAFSVGTADGRIRVASGTTLNFEGRSGYAVTVRVSDKKNAISGPDDVIDDTIDVTVNINNVEEPGVATMSTGAPQQGVQITVDLSDPDGSVSGRLWQWWRGSSSAGPWGTAIPGATSSARTPTSADVDSYLRVRVSYTDGEGSGKTAEAISEQAVVGPTIVNEAPTFDDGTATGRNVDENAAAGTNVGAQVTATDPDNDSLSYSLEGTSLFAVNGSTGRIRVAPGAGLNFESVSSYSLTMTVTDNKSPTGEFSSATDDIITVTVTINNVDEPGTVSFSTSTPEIDSAVTASLSDPDRVAPGVTWQWSSRMGTSGLFSDIAGATDESYTPTVSDAEHFLRATATYEDEEDPGKTADGVVPNAVEAVEVVKPTETRSVVTVRVNPAESVDTGGADHRAILAAEFTATAVPVEDAPEGCRASDASSTVDDNATPGIADDVVVIRLDVIDLVGVGGAGCRYDVLLHLPPGFSTPTGATTIRGVAPGTTINIRVGVALRRVLLLQTVVGDAGGADARYEPSTNCAGASTLPTALQPAPFSVRVAPIERYTAVELREGSFNISAAISADPESARIWPGGPVPALNDEGEACESSVAVSHLPARCVAERAAVGVEPTDADDASILQFRIICGDDIEAAPAAVLSDADELDAPVRVEVITPTVAGAYTVTWATWDGCDPGAGTSGMSGSVLLTVAAAAEPDATPTPGELTGTAETIAVMISPNCAYTWWASAVEATTGTACRVGPAPLVPDRDNAMVLTLVDPAASCSRDALITVRVHPAAGTDRGAVLAARFSAIAVPAKGAPGGCGTALAVSAVDEGHDESHTADDTVIIKLPVYASTSDQRECRYDVTLRAPVGFVTAPAGVAAENLEPNTSIDFLTSTGGPVTTVLLVQNVTGTPDGARARFTLFSDCLPSMLVPTPPGGAILPTRLVELREGRYNMSGAFAAGPDALDISSDAPTLVVRNQAGDCEAALSVSHLPERCTAEHATAIASLPSSARRATLEVEITCRRTTPRTSAAQG